jgi:hypothetical protein
MLESNSNTCTRPFISGGLLGRYAAEHSGTYRPDPEAVSVKEAAKLLGSSLGYVYDCIKKGRLHEFEHAPCGARKGGREVPWLSRDEVKAEKKRRVAASRVTAHIDKLGWRWLPLPLVRKECSLTNVQVQWHAEMAKSSWCLDGREHSSDNLPNRSRPRHLAWNEIPNAGHPGPTLKVYLEDECRIIADRLAGRLTAEEAADRARQIKRWRAVRLGPDGRPPAKAQAPSAPLNGHAEARPTAANGTAAAASRPAPAATPAAPDEAPSALARLRSAPDLARFL